jgi:hypothetical protein
MMPLTGSTANSGGVSPFEARVRSIGVVVDPPFIDAISRFVEVSEQVFVETLVAHALSGDPIDFADASR